MDEDLKLADEDTVQSVLSAAFGEPVHISAEDYLGKVIAGCFGHQPHMSGDQRNRLDSRQRRIVDDTARILAATITRLHATITQMTNTIDGLEFQREEAMWREADSRGVWAKLTQEQVDRAETAEAQRDAALEALRPFANAYAVLKRRGYLVAPNGTALMYDPQNPKFLGPFIEDLARAHRVYEGGEG